MSVDKICSKIYPDQANKRCMCIKRFSSEISSSFEKKVCYETASSYVLPKKGISLFECIESHYTPIIKKALDNSQGCKVSAQKKTECKKNAKEIKASNSKETTGCKAEDKERVMSLVRQLDAKTRRGAKIEELTVILKPIMKFLGRPMEEKSCMKLFAIEDVKEILDAFVRTFNLLNKRAAYLEKIGDLGEAMSDNTRLDDWRRLLYSYLDGKETKSRLEGDLGYVEENPEYANVLYDVLILDSK